MLILLHFIAKGVLICPKILFLFWKTDFLTEKGKGKRIGNERTLALEGERADFFFFRRKRRGFGFG